MQVIFVLFSGIGLTWNILFLPLIVIAQFLLTLGIIFITGAINIYIRDLEYIVNFLVTMLFYATPILYSVKMFEGSKIASLVNLNPMTIIINAYRDIFFYGHTPHIKTLLVLILACGVFCFLGLLFFRKLSKGFVLQKYPQPQKMFVTSPLLRGNQIIRRM